MRDRARRLAVHLDARLHQSLAKDCDWGTALEYVDCQTRAIEVFKTPVDALVLDPSLCPQRVADGLIILADRLNVPLVFYCALTPENAPRLLAMMRAQPDLLVTAKEEGPFGLIVRHIVEVRQSIPTHLLARIARSLEGAPPLMAISIAKLFFTTDFVSVRCVAMASAMSRRTLYRWCRKLGLCAPHILVCAAKILRAYPILKYTSSPIWVAAQIAGYQSEKTLVRQCVMFTGVGAADLRNATEEKIAERLASVVTNSQSAVGIRPVRPNRLPCERGSTNRRAERAAEPQFGF